MIKVGIIGADSDLSGEIIRILINHPETEMTALMSPINSGRSISSIHHGLIGETDLRFCDKINLEELDFLIVPNSSELPDTVINKLEQTEELKIVSLSNRNLPKNAELGISELKRKELVRGAKTAYVPSPTTVSSLIALGPLASFLLLNSNIEIISILPNDLTSLDVKEISAEIKKQLQKRQASFNGEINVKIEIGKNGEREAKTLIALNNSLPIEEIEKIFDQLYDDHNFTFITRKGIDSKEVEGTQKTLLKLQKPSPESLMIEIFYDPRMRGGAGDIVHVLNLFFGLHEKTGLSLKSSRF